jgi:hypothetical protein
MWGFEKHRFEPANAQASRAGWKILAQVDVKVQRPKAATLPPSCAPPQLEIDDDWL